MPCPYREKANATAEPRTRPLGAYEREKPRAHRAWGTCKIKTVARDMSRVGNVAVRTHGTKDVPWLPATCFATRPFKASARCGHTDSGGHGMPCPYRDTSCTAGAAVPHKLPHFPTSARRVRPTHCESDARDVMAGRVRGCARPWSEAVRCGLRRCRRHSSSARRFPFRLIPARGSRWLRAFP